MRIIKIYGTKDQLEEISKRIDKYKEKITKRNIKLEYINDKDFHAELYGYDGELKMTAKNPSEIPSFLVAIDNMPMGKIEKYANQLERCGLPKTKSTSHCFNDSTHHTCCMLGPEARKYADSSGNPIGITSENAFEMRYGKKPQNELTPWCTCTGSKVCTYYANKFKDGTHIKFIGDLDTKDEDIGIKQLKIQRHSTPGIKN